MRPLGLLLVLTACGGISAKTLPQDAPGTGPVTGSGGDPGGPPAPEIDPLEPYRNEDRITVRGSAAPGTTVELSVGAFDTVEGEADAGGDWAIEVLLARGFTTTLTAQSVNDAGLHSPVSNAVVTEACDPADTWEIEDDWGVGYADTCPNAHPYEVQLPDDGTSATLVGNVHADGDTDWYRVTAIDLDNDDQAGFERFKFEAVLIDGVGMFDILVYRGSCDTAECPSDDGYDAYSWFIEDTEPDELGNLPPDTRACGAPPRDPCEDHTGDYWIRVRRVDGGFDCTPYAVEVRNGAW